MAMGLREEGLGFRVRATRLGEETTSCEQRFLVVEPSKITLCNSNTVLYPHRKTYSHSIVDTRVSPIQNTTHVELWEHRACRICGVNRVCQVYATQDV